MMWTRGGALLSTERALAMADGAVLCEEVRAGLELGVLRRIGGVRCHLARALEELREQPRQDEVSGALSVRVHRGVVTEARLRIYEVGVAYYGRSYEEGKKIGLKDAFTAFWWDCTAKSSCICRVRFAFFAVYLVLYVGAIRRREER